MYALRRRILPASYMKPFFFSSWVRDAPPETLSQQHSKEPKNPVILACEACKRLMPILHRGFKQFGDWSPFKLDLQRKKLLLQRFRLRKTTITIPTSSNRAIYARYDSILKAAGEQPKKKEADQKQDDQKSGEQKGEKESSPLEDLKEMLMPNGNPLKNLKDKIMPQGSTLKELKEKIIPPLKPRGEDAFKDHDPSRNDPTDPTKKMVEKNVRENRGKDPGTADKNAVDDIIQKNKDRDDWAYSTGVQNPKGGLDSNKGLDEGRVEGSGTLNKLWGVGEKNVKKNLKGLDLEEHEQQALNQDKNASQSKNQKDKQASDQGGNPGILKQVAQGIKDTLKGAPVVGKQMGDALKDGLKNVSQKSHQVSDTLKEGFKNVSQKGHQVGDTLKEGIKGMSEAGHQVKESIKDGLQDFADKVKGQGSAEGYARGAMGQGISTGMGQDINPGQGGKEQKGQSGIDKDAPPVRPGYGLGDQPNKNTNLEKDSKSRDADRKQDEGKDRPVGSSRQDYGGTGSSSYGSGGAGSTNYGSGSSSNPGSSAEHSGSKGSQGTSGYAGTSSYPDKTSSKLDAEKSQGKSSSSSQQTKEDGSSTRSSSGMQQGVSNKQGNSFGKHGKSGNPNNAQPDYGSNLGPNSMNNKKSSSGSSQQGKNAKQDQNHTGGIDPSKQSTGFSTTKQVNMSDPRATDHPEHVGRRNPIDVNEKQSKNRGPDPWINKGVEDQMAGEDKGQSSS